MPITALPDEAALVTRARRDPTAFAKLYDHYAPRIYTYMRYRVDERSTAEDLTAQTFEKALVGLHSYRPQQGAFGAWLFGIAFHVVNRHYRAAQRRYVPFDSISDQASDHAQPEETAIKNALNQQLLQAVAQLKDRERDLIALKFAAGMTNRQIAALTGLSESNVGVILYRAVQQLKNRLIPQENEDHYERAD